MPFSLSPVAWLVVAGGLGVGAFWLVDAIGDRREAKVWAKINKAIDATNVDVRAHNSLDDKIAAIAEDARQKATAQANGLGGSCPATKEQAEALSRIR